MQVLVSLLVGAGAAAEAEVLLGKHITASLRSGSL
eukprot:COSAG02_NODE_57944_length_279_cov_0.572222_1_plen_34_part_01